MSSLTLKNGVLGGIAVLLLVCIVYQYDSTLFGVLGRRYDGFADAPTTETSGGAGSLPEPPAVTTAEPTPSQVKKAPAMPSKPTTKAAAMMTPPPAPPDVSGFKSGKEGFANLASAEGPAAFASAEAPAGCYPRDQLTPTELLPADQDTIYAQQNPMGVGSLKGKNFLSAGALIGVNTVGQSLRNANLQLRSEPPNPQVPVSIFLQSTIGPDISHRPLEVGS